MVQATDQDLNALAHALREAHHLSSRQLLHSNLEPAELGVLFLVFKNHVPRPSDLAAEMHLDLSTVSRHVQALEKDGYLDKVKDPDDGRAHRLRLTPAGRKAIYAAMIRRADHYRRAVERWSTDDLQTLVRLLRRFSDDLKACTECVPQGTDAQTGVSSRAGGVHR
jgi:DNA-binding MarR family transcriptional regulator